jgi:hypothetical protein
MIASGAAGSGGLGALVAGVVSKKKESLTQIGKEEVRDGDSNDAREA